MLTRPFIIIILILSVSYAVKGNVRDSPILKPEAECFKNNLDLLLKITQDFEESLHEFNQKLKINIQENPCCHKKENIDSLEVGNNFTEPNYEEKEIKSVDRKNIRRDEIQTLNIVDHLAFTLDPGSVQNKKEAPMFSENLGTLADRNYDDGEDLITELQVATVNERTKFCKKLNGAAYKIMLPHLPQIEEPSNQASDEDNKQHLNFEINFAAKAAGNVIIQLSPWEIITEESDIYFEIEISKNSVSFFRVSQQVANEYSKANTTLISPDLFTFYYIQIDNSGILKFGKEDDWPLIHHLDPYLIEIKYLSFNSANATVCPLK